MNVRSEPSRPQVIAAAVFSTTVFLSTASQAESAKDFYRGRTVNVIIGYPPGGLFDLSGRLIIRHMPKYLSDRVSLVPQNRPGAASLIAANQLYNAAPRDGSQFAVIGQAVPFVPLWDKEGVQFDATKFNWIGALQRWVGIALIWKGTPVTTFAEARTKDVLVGSTGAKDSSTIYPRVLNEILGTKFKIVQGYQGSNDLNIAIEKGEVHGRVGSCWECVKVETPNWVAANKVGVMLQLSLKGDPQLGDIPVAVDMAQSEEDRQVLRLVFGNQDMAIPFVAPPGVPEDRLALLRDAFEKTVADAEFRQEAEKMRLAIQPSNWKEMKDLVDSIYSSPATVIAKAAAIINGKP